MSGEGARLLGLGRVQAVSPLTVRLNGDTTATAATAVGSSFTGATGGGGTNATEVLIFAAERRRFALRVGT